MHRTPSARALAILMAVWFAVFSAEPLVLHACPIHDGPLAMAAGMHGAGHGHAGAGHSHAPAGHHACSCPGACCAAASVVVPSGAPTLVAAVVRPAPPSALPADALRHRPSEPEHARPPSLGPPPALHIG